MHLIHKFYIKLIKNFSLIKIKYLFIIFLLSPFLFFIVLIKPIVLIRFGDLGCERIGHFFDAELYLLSNKSQKKKVKPLTEQVESKKPKNTVKSPQNKKKIRKK